MKGRWRLVLGVACAALVGLGAGGDKPSAPQPSFPPGVTELLPHAVALWEERTIAEFGEYFNLDVVAVGDFTSDSLRDLVLSQHTTLFILPGKAAGEFGEPQVAAFYPLDKRPERFRALAALSDDLNGDGTADLILSTIIDEASGAVFIFENQRVRFRPVGSYLLPSPTDWLALLDMTADGKADLILSAYDRKRGVTSILALPRMEKFAFGEPLWVGEGRGWPVALADLDSDGHLDLVLLHYDLMRWPDTGYLTVLWGHRTGFLEGTVVKPASGEALHAAVGDLDGDEQADLIVATTRGVVTFHLVGRQFVEGYAFDPGFPLKKVWLADMDGDGFLDAILGAAFYRALAVWAGDGRGGFKGCVAEYVPPLGWIQNVYVSDVDDNRLPDLVLNYSSRVVIVRNGGLPRGRSLLSTFGHLLAVGDLSGNGAIDLVVQARDGVEVWWNNGKGGLVRAPLVRGKRPPQAAVVAHGQLYTLHQEVRRRLAPPPAYLETYDVYVLQAYSPTGDLLHTWELEANCFPLIAVGDLDGDGTEDIVLSREDRGTGTGELWVLWGGKEGIPYPLPAKGALAVVADFNGDGIDEVGAVCIADFADLRFVAFVGRKPRISDPVLQLPAQPMALTAGDLDRDGLPDPVFIALTVDVDVGPPFRIIPSETMLGMWLSARQAAQTSRTTLARGDLPWPFTGIVVGDYTGDGIGDVVFTSLAAAGPVLLPGHGDGTFGEPRVLPVPLGPLFAADLDGNGQLELVGSTQTVNPALGVLWNGGGR